MQPWAAVRVTHSSGVARSLLLVETLLQPRRFVRSSIEAFDRADVEALVGFWTEDAINRQLAEAPAQGRPALREMLVSAFGSIATVVCIVDNATLAARAGTP